MLNTGLILDGVLIVLLCAGLVYALKLDGRLKTLKSTQEAFIKAVSELDQAAIRTHNSLKDLRSEAATEQDLLHGRVMAARDIGPALEAQVHNAKSVIDELRLALAAAQSSLEAIKKAQYEARRLEQAPRPPQPAIQPRFPSAPHPNPMPDKAFDRDVVKPLTTQIGPNTRLPPSSQKPLMRLRPAERLKDEIVDEALIDHVQMSELMVANLNALIQSLDPAQIEPDAQPVSRQQKLDDLFQDSDGERQRRDNWS
jgi:hypothetical protein